MKNVQLETLYEKVVAEDILSDTSFLTEAILEPRVVYAQILRYAEKAQAENPRSEAIHRIILIAKQQLFYNNVSKELEKEPAPQEKGEPFSTSSTVPAT